MVDKNKTPSAQLPMVRNIPVKFHDSYSNTLASYTRHNFLKNGLPDEQSDNQAKNKTPGAQLPMLINIPVRVHDYFGSYARHNVCDRQRHNYFTL